MKRLIIAAAMALIGTGAMAGSGGVTQLKAAGNVATTMDALEAAVTGAGATVFARVDHAGGAEGVERLRRSC